jgi:DNA-binding XRE family transcriptional regulator
MVDTTTLAVLAAYKERCGIASDYAAAKALGVTHATISNWRNGKSHAQADLAAKMAEACGLDVLGVLAAIEADRAQNEAVRKVWRRFGRAAFLALWVASVVLPASALSTPGVGGGGGEGHDVTAHSRQWWRRWFLVLKMRGTRFAEPAHAI